MREKKLKFINVMYEVENPIFQRTEEIAEQYDNNFIVISDRKRDEKGKLLGGIVRFYGSDRNGLFGKSLDLQQSGESAIFDSLIASNPNDWKELPWFYEEVENWFESRF